MTDNELLDQIEALEDKIFALTEIVSALTCTLADAGIPLREGIRKYTAMVANDYEDDGRLPGVAVELDRLRDALDALLQHRQSNSSGKNGS